jgi:CRP-like cAMP-binding protein
MFFVVRGECEVLKGAGANRERLGFIGQGGFFGENCIIEVRSDAHVHALQYIPILMTQ